ncbi:MAG: hypothetical protein V4615_03735 [Bacteroidota bacterium]
MNLISNLFKRIANGSHEEHDLVTINPSVVLHVHREEVSGTLEIRNLNVDQNPSKVLRVSWIKRDDIQGVLKTVWIADEIALM